MFVMGDYRYEGGWVSNQRQGEGREETEGRTYTGTWAGDKKQGRFVVTEKGKTFTEYYEEGVRGKSIAG
jgi:hypothetical protein